MAMTLEMAMRRAYSLGQTYWQQADSESYSQNKKADETAERFDTLLRDTLAAHLTQPAQAGCVCGERYRGVPFHVLGRAFQRVLADPDVLWRDNSGAQTFIDRVQAETALLLHLPHAGQGSAMSNEALRKAVERIDRAELWTFDADWALVRQALRDQESALATHRANYDALVIRLGEVTTRLEAADGLLREWLVGKWCTPEYDDARQRAYDHLKAADHV